MVEILFEHMSAEHYQPVIVTPIVCAVHNMANNVDLMLVHIRHWPNINKHWV